MDPATAILLATETLAMYPALACRPSVAQTNRIHRISPVPNRPLLLRPKITQLRVMAVQVGAALGRSCTRGPISNCRARALLRLMPAVRRSKRGDPERR